MEAVLLIDFGSTYTKLTAVDIENAKVLGTAQSYTTVEEDIFNGFQNALTQLKGDLGAIEFSNTLASSSAAGGLRMITCGLVPQLTAEAAKMASLGAGAKVVKVYSYELTGEDIEEITMLKPDIFLLTGGTDGGNSKCILHNAKVLGEKGGDYPVIVAGNRSVTQQCKELLLKGFKEVYACKNVMPVFNELNIEPTQAQIKDIFLNKIVNAKGLSKVESLLCEIVMPTPMAVMQAVKLLSQGTEKTKGIGELMAIDLGGATTDVYSIASGNPDRVAVIMHGLAEPFNKRTVEGDIGMRYGALGIVAACGLQNVAKLANLDVEKTDELIKLISSKTETLPDCQEQVRLDFALASLAVDTAITRHSGTIREAYTPMGKIYEQNGKDLSKIEHVIVTGGAIVRANRANEVMQYSMSNPMPLESLKPKNAKVLTDRKYILYSMGLLSSIHQEVALKILLEELC